MGESVKPGRWPTGPFCDLFPPPQGSALQTPVSTSKCRMMSTPPRVTGPGTATPFPPGFLPLSDLPGPGASSLRRCGEASRSWIWGPPDTQEGRKPQMREEEPVGGQVCSARGRCPGTRACQLWPAPL